MNDVDRSALFVKAGAAVREYARAYPETQKAKNETSMDVTLTGMSLVNLAIECEHAADEGNGAVDGQAEELKQTRAALAQLELLNGEMLREREGLRAQVGRLEEELVTCRKALAQTSRRLSERPVPAQGFSISPDGDITSAPDLESAIRISSMMKQRKGPELHNVLHEGELRALRRRVRTYVRYRGWVRKEMWRLNDEMRSVSAANEHMRDLVRAALKVAVDADTGLARSMLREMFVTYDVVTEEDVDVLGAPRPALEDWGGLLQKAYVLAGLLHDEEELGEAGTMGPDKWASFDKLRDRRKHASAMLREHLAKFFRVKKFEEVRI